MENNIKPSDVVAQFNELYQEVNKLNKTQPNFNPCLLSLEQLLESFLDGENFESGDIVTWKQPEFIVPDSKLELGNEAIVISKEYTDIGKSSIYTYSLFLGFIKKGVFITEYIISNRLKKVHDR